MSGAMQTIGKKINDHPVISYVVPFVIGAAIFAVILITQGPDLFTFFQLDILTVPLLISGIAMRALAGIGIMLTYASVCSFIFHLSSDFVKGRERRAAFLKGLTAIIGVAIAGYAVYRIYSTLYLDAGLAPFEDLVALYGIWSLILLVYVVPAIRNTYAPEFEISTLGRVKEALGGARFSLWRGYQSRIWGEYGKVRTREFQRYGETLALWRAQLSGLLLLPICLILVPLPPLACVAFVLWFRTFSLHDTPLRASERALLVVITVTVIILRTLMYFYLEVPAMALYFDLAYSVGILASILAFLYLVTRT
ncbi:hypothetical protein EU546_03800 [Candidatus Thorarchaeota archaeon]|nr:MAG: hypothetical protein EU546_03800 [Candidatus Thorarchaeota archaeon]